MTFFEVFVGDYVVDALTTTWWQRVSKKAIVLTNFDFSPRLVPVDHKKANNKAK